MLLLKKLRRITGMGITYIILTIFALIMLFPFMVMLFTSFKLPADTFHYPPRLLPYDPITTEWPDEEEPVPLYELEVDGEVGEYALIKSGIPIGIFSPPDDLDVVYEVPLQEAEPVGGFVNQESVVIDGEDVYLYEIQIDGVLTQVAQVGRTAWGRFVNTADPEQEILRNVRLSKPVEVVAFHPENYTQVIELQAMDRTSTNTLLVTMFVVLGQLSTSILGGYAFARIRFPGRDKIFLVYVGTIMVPFIVLIVPLYQLVNSLGWVNNIVNLIVPWLYTAYGTFLMRQYFMSVPKEIEEAALIDGATRFQTLMRVILPGAVPAIATLGTFVFLYAWNSFLWPLVSINQGNKAAQVLTVTLSLLRGVSADNPNLILAGAAFAIGPPLLIYVFGQRYFVDSALSSGLKG